MSDYVRKYRRLTAAQWDWIRAKHFAGWDLVWIMADVGFGQSLVRDVIDGRLPRPIERDDDDKGCYCPTPSDIRRGKIKAFQRHMAEKRAQGPSTNHNSIGGIREVSTRGNRRLSTVGVDW